MTTRRNFLKSAAMASAGLAMGSIKLNAASYKQIIGANGKVNLACVGIGFRGNEIIKEFEKTGLANVVALCDIDMGAPHTQEIMAKYPKARLFKDFREMFDKMGNQFDAVCAGIPDFAHYPVVIHAIKEGKHIYVEKPMCRTFQEGELMMQAAKKYPKVVTQMGNQGHSEGNYFQFKAWKEADIIKDVTAVTAHMNSERRWHGWDSRIFKYPDPDPMPPGIDWDTWNMAVRYHEYNDKYHRGNWRCWYDLGMGALGDWGAHLIDTVHEFLELGLPYEVNPLLLKEHNDYFYPKSSTLQFRFAARKNMPALDITWYDGLDNIPQVPEGYGVSEIDPNIPPVAGGKLQPLKLNPGKEIYSKELTFKGGSHGSTLSIIPDEKAKEMASKLPDVPKSPSNHFANFLLSCQGKEKTRSPFEVAGPLSQVFCLGVMAQRLNTKLEFDTQTKQITNNKFANAMLVGEPPRSGWESYYEI
ncbi:MAG: Gfo/Idh/MocA family oxidoreductase [Tannerella sp.]|nr:Gfo/Idh/MocA family oxidoreductase [Tannerella sp.]